FVTWAMSSNRFFSGEVRIQRDRGHKVVSGGPYAIVRHPAYGGLLVCLPMIALLLESMWALAAAALVAVPVVVRTALEDRALRRDLAGYAEYADQVRYRLFPGVW
ncbi:MAG: isoprenylcysteine carboxyl methyltransferase, partial [Dehalococcoidia bacterium]